MDGGIMKHVLFYLLVSVLGIVPGSLMAEFRSWTNTEGKNVEAELTKVDGDSVTIRLRSGTLSTFSQSKLSEVDRDYIVQHPPSAVSATPAPTQRAESGPPAVDAKRKARWLGKMAKAMDESKVTGLPILVLFTGTSWCPYCIKLEDELFSKKEFSAFANQNLVLLKLDYGPGGKSPNKEQETLQKDFQVRGFPSYFLINASDTRLAKGGYHSGINPKDFADWVKGATHNPNE